ncbi:CarD family transcriptional regulator [Anaeropeptidivorans aminofermentans]|uniref:CarD family transcriptional regulator n=1 Tax=Anaeropeptidivorans aminofermentans TaxID=2934315 RepID=UPI0020250CF6|nr:CarD family transcriptional regulator [Anaeropeptidivorans aminofermentans]MBE6011467.1 CarD family transcriptional regulator [Lachnospiraceae bacterium]
MFCKGDKVVYPMYGAGVIEDLEEKLIDGVSRIYYIMNIPVGNLKISVSAGNAEVLGLREIYSSNRVMSVLEKVSEIPVEMPENWNERYKCNLAKIKTGKLIEVVEVYRNLYLREKARGLSSVEKKLLSNAKQIVISEIVLAQNVGKEEAEDILFSYAIKWS